MSGKVSAIPADVVWTHHEDVRAATMSPEIAGNLNSPATQSHPKREGLMIALRVEIYSQASEANHSPRSSSDDESGDRR